MTLSFFEKLGFVHRLIVFGTEWIKIRFKIIRDFSFWIEEKLNFICANVSRVMELILSLN